MSAQHLLLHTTSAPHCNCIQGRVPAASIPKRSDLVALSVPRGLCVARGHSSNGSRPQAAAQQTQEAHPNAHNAANARQWISAWRSKQVSNAQALNTKKNGSKVTGGSSSSNQAGQATAPKAPGEASPRAKPAPKSKPFSNINKFIVPEDKLEEFEATWHEREEFMQQMPGFLGFSMERQDGSDFVTTSKWASIPEWEAYSLSEIARRSHLPWGVYQYVPAKGEGFPEDFIPFKAMDTLVNAKY
ncbi:hypothetical protein ABBQ38_001319 [Trebouxia sp. C0009 RCD-2024]